MNWPIGSCGNGGLRLIVRLTIDGITPLSARCSSNMVVPLSCGDEGGVAMAAYRVFYRNACGRMKSSEEFEVLQNGRIISEGKI